MFDITKKYWFNKDDDAYTQRRKKQRFIRNHVTGLDFEMEMFDDRKSYQILFITLIINKLFRDDVGFGTMQKLRDILFRRIKDAHAYERKRKRMGRPLEDHERTIFHDICGLIWRQEAGGNGDENHHLHLVVFVRASLRNHRIACDELGMAWQRITSGWGDFHNGNRYAHSYRNKWGVAVGYVHRDDKEKRSALQKLIGLYMAKVSQMPVDCGVGNLHGTRRF